MDFLSETTKYIGRRRNFWSAVKETSAEFMFELTDFTKVDPDHKPIRTPPALDAKPGWSYGAADEVAYNYGGSKFEEGEILTYFKSRRLSHRWISWWLGLQITLLFFQMVLYSEVASHSSLYDRVVHKACNEEKVGSCSSRLWRVRHDQVYPIDHITHLLEQSINFHFSAGTWSAAELQLNVIPDPPELHFPYEMILKRVGNQNVSDQTYYEYRTAGVSPVFIKETPASSISASMLFSGKFAYSANWEGTLQLARFANRFGYHGHAPSALHALRGVRVVVNEMISIETAIFKNRAPNCDLEPTWSNLMLKSMSVGSQRLVWIKHCLFVSILGSLAVAFLVYTWQSGRRMTEGVKFHYLVAAKSVLQDFPLQALVLWYIFSWYEGGGERCQLCLLEPRECEKMSPFHFSNLVLVGVILASALSNQFLFSADAKELKTEDDVAFVALSRAVIACVATLPFSTSMVAFNGSLIQLPGLLHTVFLLPCFIGWVGFFSALCFPVTTLLDDDDYLRY